MLCARAVLPIFRQQQAGVLINVGSLVSQVGQPFVPSYAISKYAVRGLTDALRTELAEQRNIHVCTLLPYAIDTQHFESAANVLGKPAFGMQPVQQPEDVARAVVRLVQRPRRQLYVPAWDSPARQCRPIHDWHCERVLELIEHPSGRWSARHVRVLGGAQRAETRVQGRSGFEASVVPAPGSDEGSPVTDVTPLPRAYCPSSGFSRRVAQTPDQQNLHERLGWLSAVRASRQRARDTLSPQQARWGCSPRTCANRSTR